jgi:hypothetical protein
MVDSAADQLARPIADAYLSVTQAPPIQVNARIRLPSGLMIDADEIVLKSDQTFTYQGLRYKVTQRGTDNVYQTVKV